MMKPKYILEMLATNREQLKRKRTIALENLSMLHSSFDEFDNEGSVIALALNDSIATMVYDADYSKAITISQSVIDRFPRSQYVQLIAHHEMTIGRCYTFSMAYDLALEHLRRAEMMAFDILPQAEETKTLRADIMHELGMTIAQSGGDKEDGIRYMERALRIIGQDAGHEARRGVYTMGVGNVRFGQERYEDALNIYMRAEVLLQGTDSYINLAAILCNLGVCHMCLSTLQIAETYMMQALELRIKRSTYGDIAGSYYNLAALYERRGDIEKAYATMLISHDYARVSQVRKLQIMIIHELESMSRTLGDDMAAEKHHKLLAEVEYAYA